LNGSQIHSIDFILLVARPCFKQGQARLSGREQQILGQLFENQIPDEKHIFLTKNRKNT